MKAETAVVATTGMFGSSIVRSTKFVLGPLTDANSQPMSRSVITTPGVEDNWSAEAIWE